ncbi:MAG: hypothetical protein K2X35_13930 [Bryobacteraceae bacterium]|nr:hypothetical protein [Bryobacteraceae bacterium]
MALVGFLAATSPGERVRVFVEDSRSWEITGEIGGGSAGGVGGFGGSTRGGARPQTVEIIKTFGERCPRAIITMDRAKADYMVLFDREGGKALVRRDNKIAVFEKGGDILYSGSTRSLGNAVKDACGAITAHLAAGDRK